jgi:hypothetical protein
VIHLGENAILRGKQLTRVAVLDQSPFVQHDYSIEIQQAIKAMGNHDNSALTELGSYDGLHLSICL